MVTLRHKNRKQDYHERSSDFSEGAKDEATRPDAVPVALMNGEQLVALMVQHEVMVTRRPHDILDLSLTDED